MNNVHEITRPIYDEVLTSEMLERNIWATTGRGENPYTRSQITDEMNNKDNEQDLLKGNKNDET